MAWPYDRETLSDHRIGCLNSKGLHQHLIPALTGQPPCSSIVRDLLALPVRLGGLGLRDPSATSSDSFQSSERITAPLVALIISQDTNESIDPDTTSTIKTEVKKRTVIWTTNQGSWEWCIPWPLSFSLQLVAWEGRQQLSTNTLQT